MSLDGLIQWDQQATLWINSLHSPASDKFWLLMSDVRIWFPAYFLIMLFIVWHMGWKKGLAWTVALILTIVLCDRTSAELKYVFERLRPCYNTWMIENGLHWPYGHAGGFFGFFSSHASNVFGFASLLSWAMKWYGKPKTARILGISVFVWATLVSVSRIMMAAHFLGDVLVGAVFGLLAGTAVAFLTRWVITKARL